MKPSCLRALFVGGMSFVLVLLTSCQTVSGGAGDLYSEDHLPLEKWDRNSSCCVAQGKKIAIASGGVNSSKAGLEISAQGGNIVDAAVAVAFTLAVERQKSAGIGGGGFMTLHLAGEKNAGNYFVDFRESAPGKSTKTMFLSKNGTPIPDASTLGGLAVATPGFVAGYFDIHKRWGKLPWKKVLEPAIRIAEQGYAVPLDQAEGFAKRKSLLAKDPGFRNLFNANGETLKAGELVVQKELAKTLRLIADKGKAAFYAGPLAQKIAAVTKKTGGILTVQDLKNYKVKFREPIRSLFKDHVLISAPPPSAGGVLTAEMLNVLDGFDLKTVSKDPAKYTHLLAETMKRAYADRSHFIGDPDYFKANYQSLLTREYAEKLRSTINLEKATPSEKIRPKGESPSGHGTTQMSLIDSDGNAISSTISVNSGFGAFVVVPDTGIWLNNTMDDFSIKPGEKNLYGFVGTEANAIGPNKRPVSSMTPSIILDEVSQRPVLALGGGGGSKIITSTFQVALLNLIITDKNLQRSVFAPRIHHQWLPDKIEIEPFAIGLDRELKERFGHVVIPPGWQAEVQAVSANLATGELTAVFDPRFYGGAEAQ